LEKRSLRAQLCISYFDGWQYSLPAFLPLARSKHKIEKKTAEAIIIIAMDSNIMLAWHHRCHSSARHGWCLGRDETGVRD